MAILAKLKQINNFNIPVVLMSKDSKVEYNNDYLQAGFNDIIIKSIWFFNSFKKNQRGVTLFIFMPSKRT